MKRSRESGTLNSPWIKQGYQKKGPLAQSRPGQWVSAAPYCPGFASCSSGGLVCSLAFSGQFRRRVTLDCLNIFFQTSCSHSFVECMWTEENPHGGRDQVVHVVRGESFLSRGRNWKQSGAEVGLHKDVRALPSAGQHLVDSRIRIRPKNKALCRYLLLFAARKVMLDLAPVLRGREFQPDCRVWSNSLPLLIWLHFVYLKLFHLFSTCSGASSVLGITLVTKFESEKKQTMTLTLMEPTCWWKRQLLHSAQVTSSHRL